MGAVFRHYIPEVRRWQVYRIMLDGTKELVGEFLYEADVDRRYPFAVQVL